MFRKVFKLAPASVIFYPLLMLLSWIVAWVIAVPLSPLVATISMITGRKDVGGPLSYLYTHNASLDGGIEQKVEGYEADAKGFRLWWQRVRWICRNPAYKFNAYVLGFSGDGASVIFRQGVEYPDFALWTVVQSASGRRFFGYRGKSCWFGWNYTTYGGYHQLKSKPF